MLVETILHQVQLGEIVARTVVANDGFVVHDTDRGTVVGHFCSGTEGNVVVVHKTRADGHLREVGIIALVDIAEAHLLGSLTETVGVEHVQAFVGVLETYIRVIGNVELPLLAALGAHHDDAGSSAATILSRLGCILQNGKTLDVQRIDARQRQNVAMHTVDDDQRVVATRQRSGTAYTYCRQCRLLVHARLYLHTRSLTVQHVKRVEHKTLLQLCFRQLVDGARQHHLRAFAVANRYQGGVFLGLSC